MKKSSELIKNTFVLFIGKAFTQFLSLLLLPLYTKNLGADEYGQLDLITTYAALAIPLIGLQIESGLFRYLIDNRNNQKNKRILVTNATIAILPPVMIATVLFCFISIVIKLPNFEAITLSVISSLTVSYLQQMARGLGDNIGFSIGSIVTGVSTIALNAIFIFVLQSGIVGILIANSLANAIGILFFIIRNKVPKLFKLSSYDKNEIFKLLKYCAPLIPNNVIWWIISVSDRTIISIFMSTAANGIYAVSCKFPHIIMQIYGIFNLSWTESASLHINENDRDEFFSNTFNTTIKVFTSMSLLMLAFMPILFKIMVGEDYNEAYLYIPILSVGTVLNIVVSFIGAIYIAKKKTKEVAITSFWSGLLNIVINLVLIKTIGIWAAAISTLLAFLIMAIYRYFDVQKYVKLKLNKKMATSLLLLTAICVTLYFANNIVAIITNMAVVTMASVYINRGIIKTVAKTIKTKFLN